jgi:hypothetical protein
VPLASAAHNGAANSSLQNCLMVSLSKRKRKE